MLDALLAEARLRWGLDPADGLRDRRHRAAGRHADRAVASPADRAGGAPAARAPMRARRHRPARPPRPRRSRSDRRRCGGCTPPITRWAGSACPTGRPSASSRRTTSTEPLYLAPRRAGRRRRVAVGHALDLGPPAGAGRLPVGPRADPRVAPQPPARGGVRGLRRARRRRDARARGRARRPAAPGRAPRAARGRGGRVRHDRRRGRRSRPRSCAATRTCSARPRRAPRPT